MGTRDLTTAIRGCFGAGLLGTALTFAPAAIADIEAFGDTNVGGWVEDTATPAFLAAVGDQPTEHLTFATDKDGEPVPHNEGGECFCEGTLFSNWLELRSPDSSIAQNRVLVAGLNIDSAANEVRVAGDPSYAGALEILFFDVGEGSTTALGFGGVAFGKTSSVTLYDENDVLIASYPGVSNNTFTFIGFVATDGDRIGRAVLQGFEGGDFAIQDLTFVPEPGAGSAAIAALLVIALFRARRPR